MSTYCDNRMFSDKDRLRIKGIIRNCDWLWCVYQEGILLTQNLSFKLKETLIEYYLWSTALYGFMLFMVKENRKKVSGEPWNLLPKKIKQKSVNKEDRYYISWKYIERSGRRSINLLTIRWAECHWMVHILRRNC